MLEGDDLVDESFALPSISTAGIALRDCRGIQIRRGIGIQDTGEQLSTWVGFILNTVEPILIDNKLSLPTENDPEESIERCVWYEGTIPSGEPFRFLIWGIAKVIRRDDFDEVRWIHPWKGNITARGLLSTQVPADYV